jgi:hypothetical protein
MQKTDMDFMPRHEQTLYGQLKLLELAPWKRFVSAGEILPVWILLAPVGIAIVFWRSWIAAMVLTVGLITGLAPVVGSLALRDTTTFVEVFRYGAFAMPWLALGAGAALGFSASWPGAQQGTRGPHWTRSLAVGIGALILVSTPLAHRGYLATAYGPTQERDVFLMAMQHVPRHCGVIVPDERGELGDNGTLEIVGRYSLALTDAQRGGTDVFPPENVVGVSDVLAILGGQPAGVHAESSQTGRAGRPSPLADGDGSEDGEDCWYFFQGLYCEDGVNGVPPTTCQELLERTAHVPVDIHTIDYRHHRLVTHPAHDERPWSDPERRLILYELPELAGQLRAARADRD